MKKTCKILLLVIVSLTLYGCGEKGEKDINNQFIIVSEDHNINTGNLYITYDKDTKVMYYVSTGSYKYAISPIYDTDGSVKIYKGE